MRYLQFDGNACLSTQDVELLHINVTVNLGQGNWRGSRNRFEYNPLYSRIGLSAVFQTEPGPWLLSGYPLVPKVPVKCSAAEANILRGVRKVIGADRIHRRTNHCCSGKWKENQEKQVYFSMQLTRKSANRTVNNSDYCGFFAFLVDIFYFLNWVNSRDKNQFHQLITIIVN